MKNKRIVVRIIKITVAAAIAVAIGVTLWLTVIDPMQLVRMYEQRYAYISDEDFNECFDAFNDIAEIALEYDKEHKGKDYSLYFNTPTKPEIYESIDVGSFKSIEISDKDKDGLRRIMQAFERKYAVLDRIKIDNGFVFFRIEVGTFAVVYSPDGKMPEYIAGLQDRNYSFYTRKVRDKWYFVTAVGA
jgi:hypothetical protein